MNYHLPRCMFVRRDCSGRYEVCHTETSPHCHHTPSGGTGGFPDGITPCNRVIGHGKTKGEAIVSAFPERWSYTR